MFNVHWLNRMSHNAIIKVDVTERNDITVQLLQNDEHQKSKWLHYQKIHVQKWKVRKKKNLSWMCGVDTVFKPGISVLGPRGPYPPKSWGHLKKSGDSTIND